MPPTSTLDRLPIPRDNFHRQVAVVTGAGQGLGRAIARAFGRFGARVVVADISEAGQQVADRIEADGGEASYVHTNVADLESVAALTNTLKRQHGRVDVLVNNALRAPVISTMEMGVDVFEEVVDVNLRGPFLVTKAMLPEMVERGAGTIVNMVSTASMPYLSAYSATKGGVVGLTESLAGELDDQGVRTVAFEPGMVDTRGMRAIIEKIAPRLGYSPEEFVALSPHPAYPGLMPPEDAAAAALYLAAELSDQFHGQVTDGYRVLERAGLISSAADQAPADPASGEESSRDPLELARCVQQIIARTADEFADLPAMMRPFARRGFESKVGMSLREWRGAAERLSSLVERAQRGEPAASSTLAREKDEWVGRLSRLVEYLAEVPRETSHHVDDSNRLEDVTREMAEHEGMIRQLIEAIERLAERR
jgi:NAD(P)-dependent dehydrogenase (short-subunit alcohol dehydrogenase family)